MVDHLLVDPLWVLVEQPRVGHLLVRQGQGNLKILLCLSGQGNPWLCVVPAGRMQIASTFRDGRLRFWFRFWGALLALVWILSWSITSILST